MRVVNGKFNSYKYIEDDAHNEKLFASFWGFASKHEK